MPALDLASEAARLFADRAMAVNLGFALTAETAPAVAAICARLDGMPLAIELAAAQIRMLTVQEIADGLDDGFSLLVGGAPDGRLPPPHPACGHRLELRSAAPAEQLLFRRLAVFAGGFTRHAAEGGLRRSGSGATRGFGCFYTWWTSRSWLSAPNTASRGTCSRRSSGSTRTDGARAV